MTKNSDVSSTMNVAKIDLKNLKEVKELKGVKTLW